MSEQDLLTKLTKLKIFWKFKTNSQHHVQTGLSGLHSESYLNTDLIVSDPKLLNEIIAEYFLPIIEKLSEKPKWIVTYPPFGLAIAYALAEKIGAKFAYIDKETKKCNFPIAKNETVLILADEIYSGKSVVDTIIAMKALNATIIGPIVSIANFSKNQTIENIQIRSAITYPANMYAAQSCPMCKNGSKAILPRPNWDKLTNSK